MLSRTVSKLKQLMNMLQNGSERSLLQIPGVGPKSVEKILQMRASVQEKQRPFRMCDVHDATPAGIRKHLFPKDPSAMDIIHFLIYYEKKISTEKQLCYPGKVVSIDLGSINSAYTLIDCHYKVQEWGVLDFGLPRPYSVVECYDNVKKCLETLPEADMYIIEEQSCRTPTHQGILGISVQLRCLEAMVYAVLRHHREGALVNSMPPKLTAKYFDISSKKTAIKKKMGVKLVTGMVEGDVLTPLGKQVLVPHHLEKYFFERKKKDDLSDCLLQGVALLDWSSICRMLYCTES